MKEEEPMPKTLINYRIKKYTYCDIEQIYKEIDTSPNGMTYDQIKNKDKSSSGKTAYNGKGISVGYLDKDDYYQYQVLRFYK